MKSKKLIALFLTASMLCGFQSAPKEVQKNVAQEKEMNSKHQIEKKTAEEQNDSDYATLEEISANVKNLNLDEDCVVQIPNVKSCGILEMQSLDNFGKNNPDIIKKFVNNTFESQNCDENTQKSSREPEYGYDEKGNTYCDILDSGFFYYTNRDDLDLNTLTLEKEYDTFLGCEEEEYEMKDGSLTVSKAIQRAEQFLEEWQKQTGDGEHRLYKCSVYKDEDHFLYCLQFQKTQDQIPIMHLTPKTSDLPKKAFQKTFGMDCMEVYIDSCKESPFCVSNQYMLEKLKERETYAQIFTLEAALQRLNDMHTECRKSRIKSISLEYLPFSEEEELKNGEIPALQEPGEKCLLKPVWLIQANSKERNEIYAIVDCKTGDVSYVKNWM